MRVLKSCKGAKDSVKRLKRLVSNTLGRVGKCLKAPGVSTLYVDRSGNGLKMVWKSIKGLRDLEQRLRKRLRDTNVRKCCWSIGVSREIRRF